MPKKSAPQQKKSGKETVKKTNGKPFTAFQSQASNRPIQKTKNGKRLPWTPDQLD